MPEEIKRLMAVIPDMQTENLVDEKPDEKLQRRDNSAAAKAAPKKRQPLVFFIDYINSQKRRAAREPHGPVRVAAPKDFNEAVKKPAERKNTKIFSDSFHWITRF